MSMVDVSKCLGSMKQEMESLEKKGTWSIMKAPNNKRIVGWKLFFKKKKRLSRESGPIYKARVVAKGYSHVKGIDFHEVFSAVVKHSLIRALLALVAMEDLKLHQLDVKTTFLHGDLERRCT